jgi:hypothetical protein
MGNFLYRSQFVRGFAGEPVELRASISFGAAGAPTLVAGTGMGISSVVRNSAGDFTIALSQAFVSLMGVDHVMISSAASAAPELRVKANSVSSASAPSIEIVTSAAGTATDPASGEIMLIKILLNRSSTGN